MLQQDLFAATGDSPTDSGAHFSPCGKYRYALWRHWDWQGHANCVMFVGMNPSTADELRNDKTISNCIGFAKRWGMGGIYMLNLYAYRATYPSDMHKAADPVGPGNDEAFGYYRTRVGLIVAAWGAGGSDRVKRQIGWQRRIDAALSALAQPVYCLGRTQDGSPKHPSRLGYATERELFWSPTP